MKVTIKDLKKLIKEAVEEETQNFKTSFDAFKWAKRHGPSDKSREAVYESPYFSFLYAEEVDKGPHIVTRHAVLSDPSLALKYAKYIDKGPHDDTRKAASKTAKSAFVYAYTVDGHSHPVTRAGVAKDKEYLEEYEDLFIEE
jgi:hypothetical protein